MEYWEGGRGGGVTALTFLLYLLTVLCWMGNGGLVDSVKTNGEVLTGLFLGLRVAGGRGIIEGAL